MTAKRINPRHEAMRLYDAAGTRIEVGDRVTTFRDEDVTVTGWIRPHTEASTGRVIVRFDDGTERQFYPGVCYLAWGFNQEVK